MAGNYFPVYPGTIMGVCAERSSLPCLKKKKEFIRIRRRDEMSLILNYKILFPLLIILVNIIL